MISALVPAVCLSRPTGFVCVCTESVHPASVCVGGSEWLLGRSEHWQGRAPLVAAKPRMRMAAKASIAAGNGMSTAVVGKRQHQQHQQRQLLRGGNHRCWRWCLQYCLSCLTGLYVWEGEE
jgi:hypothetical protein